MPVRRRRRLLTALGVAAAALAVAAGPAVSPAPPAAAAPGDEGEPSVFVPLVPQRVMDRQPVGPGGTAELDLSRAGLATPSGTTAVALTVTAAGVTSRTFVSVCPGGTARDDCRRTSTLNPYPGRDVANFAVSPLGPSPAGGEDGLVLYNDRGSALLVVDVVGYYVATAVAPAGATEFRSQPPARDDEVPALGAEGIATVTVDGVPAGATAVAVRATAAGVTQRTFVSVCPAALTRDQCRRTSTLNPAAGRDTSNMTIVPLGGPGGDRIQVYNNEGSVIVYLDVVGFQVPRGQGAQFVPVEPVRYLEAEPLSQAEDATFPDPLNDLTATALLANITTSGNTATTYLSSCPAIVSLTACSRTSTVNSYPGQDTAAGAVVTMSPGLGGSGFTLYNSRGDTLVYLDVFGYFAVPDPTVGPLRPILTASEDVSYAGPLLSGNGRTVAFVSDTDLDGTESGGTDLDVFAVDVATGSLERVSRPAQASSSGTSTNHSISGDGRFVAFQSSKPGLVPGGLEYANDVFVRDLLTDTTTLVSRTRSGTGAGATVAWRGAMSADGNFVVFMSRSPDLVPDDSTDDDAFLWNRRTGAVTLVTPTIDGAEVQGSIESAAVSDDGRYVVFEAISPNLAAGDSGFSRDAFVRDTSLGTTLRVPAPGEAFAPDISSDGGTVVFLSSETELRNRGGESVGGVYTHVLSTGRTTRVSNASSGSFTGYTGYSPPSVGPDGRFVTYGRSGGLLVATERRFGGGAYVTDTRTSRTYAVSRDLALTAPSLSDDGRTVVVQSWGSVPTPGEEQLPAGFYVATLSWP